MDGLIITGIIALTLLCIASRNNKTADYDIDAEDVREGVENGWYNATLVIKSDQPGVKLSGKLTNGKDFTGVYTISERDWTKLKNEGYRVEV